MLTKSAVDWTESATPLPSVPLSKLENPVATKTIRDNPDLFKIVTPINVDLFESLLSTHPNQPFVASVCKGLREGFWPWADTHWKEYPETFDATFGPPTDPAEAQFLRDQRDKEFTKGRFSRPFGTELLPGMYSMPIHAVPKPHSEDFRMIMDQSAGRYSLNSMIQHDNISGYPLDDMSVLGNMLLFLRKAIGADAELIMFKSDVAEAYRHMPMSFYWSIKQANTIDGVRSLDLCNAFGGRGAQAIWISFMALVIWIAKYIRLIHLLLVFSDNTFGPNLANDYTFYPPYKKSLPSNQAKFLVLLDDLRIPHSEKKQVSGAPLVVIGIEVDPNNMTLTLPAKSKEDLIDKISRFCATSNAKTSLKFMLREWQALGGHLNWAFNVFLLLRPCTCALYAKIAGKDAPNAAIWVNNIVREELLWAKAHLIRASGVRLVHSVDWDTPSVDITFYCDASLEGFGFYLPASHTVFYGEIPDKAPKNLIFFYEALCVVFALHHTARTTIPSMAKIVIFTDNENTVHIFSSLHALPEYNILLRTSCDFLMETMHQLRVVHVPGRENIVADALSRKLFHLAKRSDSLLAIKHFKPPDSLLGALKL